MVAINRGIQNVFSVQPVWQNLFATREALKLVIYANSPLSVLNRLGAPCGVCLCGLGAESPDDLNGE